MLNLVFYVSIYKLTTQIFVLIEDKLNILKSNYVKINTKNITL